MRICIIGTGYVGLVTGTCLAENGNIVWCVDIDTVKINSLNAGIMPIYEPGLKELVLRNTKAGRLFFTNNFQSGIENAQFCFIAVGTPPNSNGTADLSQVWDVARAIGLYMNKYMIVVNKSTVPVGTAERVREIIQRELAARHREDITFDVVSNPEFLKEGSAIEDFMRPDRIVIGADNAKAAELVKQLYQPFVRNQHPILIMDIKSAEITKYAANTMLATRISFMNELARLCDRVGGDIASVRKGIGSDRRIGMQFLYAGIGYGGSCFPKDIKELIATGRKHGLEMEIAAAVERVNEKQKIYLIDMVIQRFGEDLRQKRFGIWGLAFKPQTDDVREAPAIAIIKALISRGAAITAYDPEAMSQAKAIFAAYSDHVSYVETMLEAVNGADALILATEWREFKQPDYYELKRRLASPVIFDGRNQYDPELMVGLGFEYYCIGRNRYGQ